MTRNSKQQFAVYAHYTDGTVEDITRRAQYESNDQEIAVVDRGRAGSHAGHERRGGHHGSLPGPRRHLPRHRAARRRRRRPTSSSRRPSSISYTSKKWQELGLVPCELCTDEQFIRRVSLDLTGTLADARSRSIDFVADKDPNKRDKLVDTLLDTPEYSYYFANKWADILRVKRRGQHRAGQGHLRFPRLDSRGDRRRQALRRVRPRHPRRHRRRDRAIRRRCGTRN